MKKIVTILLLTSIVCHSQAPVRDGNKAGSGLNNKSLSNGVNYTQKIFNVKEFGAIGDGTANDRPAVQAAMDSCFNSGGGIVYFPNGTYKIAGDLVTSGTFIGNPNSLLYIKQKEIFDAQGLIKMVLRGEGVNQTYSGLADYTVKRPAATVLADPNSVSGNFPALLGMDPGALEAYGMNYGVDIVIENMQFMVKARVGDGGPNLSGLNLRNFGNAIVNNNMVIIDTSLNRSSFPTAETFGIYMPNTNNGTLVEANNNFVGGFKYGLIVAEHFRGSGNEIAVCDYGLLVEQTNHGIHIDNIGIQWCRHTLSGKVGTIRGNGAMENKSVISVDAMNIEYRVNGSWYDSRYTIADSLDMLYGSIGYTIVEANVGLHNSRFSKNGGNNLACYANATQHAFTSSSANSLTLVYGYDYNFTGTSTIWTLPAISTSITGRQNGIKIFNTGTGSITLKSKEGSTLYTNVPKNSIIIKAGESCELFPNGNYFKVLYNK